VVNETPLEESEHGLVPAGDGWFVANVRDMRWSYTPGMGHGCALTGRDEHEAQTRYVDGLLPSDGGATVKRP
jgi:hypothetical protein